MDEDEVVEVKVRDLKEAYTKGSSDVKDTLKRMYPDVTFGKKWINITLDIAWRMTSDNFLYGEYRGKRILLASPSKGVVTREWTNSSYGGRYKVEAEIDTFRVYERQ